MRVTAYLVESSWISPIVDMTITCGRLGSHVNVVALSLTGETQPAGGEVRASEGALFANDPGFGPGT